MKNFKNKKKIENYRYIKERKIYVRINNQTKYQKTRNNKNKK